LKKLSFYLDSKMKILILILSMGYTYAHTFRNVAVTGVAEQSDDHQEVYVGSAGIAIDGNKDGHFHTITHTESKGRDAWWSLTLGCLYHIAEIRVWNREDCCTEDIVGATVYIDNTMVGIVETDALNPISFSFPNLFVVGSVITIIGNGDVRLSLAEVEVYGETICENIASEGTATQKDTLVWGGHSAAASLAIDGNTNGFWNGKTITHTLSNSEAWWKLTFDYVRHIGYIVIYNRLDSEGRLDGAEVYVGNVIVGKIKVVTGTKAYTFKNINKESDTITIKQPTNYLNIAEVEVYGY